MLRGQRLVPVQIQAEWVEYQLIFDDLLGRMSVSLARQAKAERKRLRRLQEDQPESDPQQQSLQLVPSSKAALRSAAADRLGLGPLRSRLPHSQPEPQVEEAAQ